MKVFIGILILIGIQSFLEMYWSTQYSVICTTPGIANIMPRVRFEQFFRCVHLCNSSSVHSSWSTRTQLSLQGQEVARLAYGKV